MRIDGSEHARAYLTDHYMTHAVAGELPDVEPLPAAGPFYRFAVYFPHSGNRKLVYVGPRGGITTVATFDADTWQRLRWLWP